MAELKVGIVGCGKMGHVYAASFSRHPLCTVTSFYNRTCSRAEALSSQYPGSRVFSRWEELISSKDLDIIGICTPSHEHLPQVKLALETGKHVLCEKPMARDIAECRQMLDLAQKAQTQVMVGFQMRFHPVVQKVDEILAEIGEIFHIDFLFGMYRPEVTWRHDLLQKGGVLKELASHLFDLAIHWLGSVSAVTGINRIIQPGRSVEDYSLNLLEFKNGATGYLVSNYQDRRDRAIHGNLIGTRGQIQWQFSSYDPADSRITLSKETVQQVPVTIPEYIDRVYPGHLDSFYKEITHFVDGIHSNRMPVTGCKEGSDVIEIIDASYESQRRGQRIELPLEQFDSEHIKECFK